MKRAFKCSGVLFSIICSLFLLSACSKSLEKTLVDGSGTWDVKMSDGSNFTVTFFEDRKATVQQGNSSDNGRYDLIGEENIILQDENGNDTGSLKNIKLSGDTIKGDFERERSNGKTTNFTMTKTK